MDRKITDHLQHPEAGGPWSCSPTFSWIVGLFFFFFPPISTFPGTKWTGFLSCRNISCGNLTEST
jgi:hypothetical protein